MPVAYKSTLKICSDFEEGKLEQPFNNNGINKVKVEVPLFAGQQGLEGLVCIVTRFQDACKTLDWVDRNEMFKALFAKLHHLQEGQAYI